MTLENGVPEKAGTPTGHAIVPSANAPLAFVGTPTGHEIAPSANAPLVLVPAGVPALLELVVAEDPVNVCAGTVPLDPVNIWDGTVPLDPVNTGTPTGHAIVPDGVNAAVPFVPAGVYESIVNAGALLVPAGVPPLTALVVLLPPVNVGAATVPVGVIVSDPPVVPASPLAIVVPITVNPAKLVSSLNPMGHELDLLTVKSPLGIDPPPMASCVHVQSPNVEFS